MTLILITKEIVSVKSIGLAYVNVEDLILMWFMDYKWALLHFFFHFKKRFVSLLISNHVFKLYLHLINAQGNRLEYCVSCLGCQFTLLGCINLYKDGAMINVKWWNLCKSCIDAHSHWFNVESQLGTTDQNNPLYWDTSDFIPYAVLSVVTLR